MSELGQAIVAAGQPAPRSTGEGAADAGADALLLRYLRVRGGRCPLCRGDLSGISQAVCPTCRERLVLGVGIAHPFLYAWVALAIGLLLAAGFGVLAILITASEGLPSERLLSVCLIYFMANIPLAAACVLMRRRFMRLPRTAQWSIAIPVAIATLVMFGMLFSFIR
jgi:hypothetical protein